MVVDIFVIIVSTKVVISNHHSLDKIGLLTMYYLFEVNNIIFL